MEPVRCYTSFIAGFDALDLPLQPVRTVHQPQRDIHAPVGSLPQVVRGSNPDVGPPFSDKAEASSEAESDDSILSRASEVLADEYHWKAELEELFKRSAAIRDSIHQLSGSSEECLALGSIADKLDDLASNYDCSTVRSCTFGAFDQAVECSPRTLVHPRGWAPGVALGGGGRRANQIPQQQVLGPPAAETAESLSAEQYEQSPSTPVKKLRCLFYVGNNGKGHQCGSTFNNMRDLIIHLRSHRVWYCRECSQRFRSKAAWDEHSHETERRCIDIECVNKQHGQTYHAPDGGCSPLKHKKDIRQWLSIFNLIWPNSTHSEWTHVQANVYSVHQPVNQNDDTQGDGSLAPSIHMHAKDEVKSDSPELMDSMSTEAPYVNDPDAGSLPDITNSSPCIEPAQLGAASLREDARSLRELAKTQGTHHAQSNDPETLALRERVDQIERKVDLFGGDLIRLLKAQTERIDELCHIIQRHEQRLQTVENPSSSNFNASAQMMDVAEMGTWNSK